MRRRFKTWLCWTSLASVVVIVMPLQLAGQKTMTNDAGAGAKVETDSDAHGKTVESRTLGAGGKLSVRMNYGYNSSSEVVKQTNTSYWPDGKSVEKIATITFDNNSNLVSEIVEDYNQSGVHVSGHQLFHDPMTGIYRCFEWKAAQQKNVAIDCPESEESHEGPHDAPAFTREEVLQHLAEARQAAQTEDKSRRVKLKTAAQSPVTKTNVTNTNKDVALVLPASLQPGQRVSGSVVQDPSRFAGQPELMVVRIALPIESQGDGTLSGWTIQLRGSDPQPADQPISFVVPDQPAAIEFAMQYAGDSGHAIHGKIQLSPPGRPRGAKPGSYESPALCFKGDLCVVTGRFSGDSSKTLAAFDSVPAKILVETESAAYVAVPAFMEQGPTTLIVAEGTKVEAMMMVVAELALAPNQQPTQSGQRNITTLHVDTVQELSDQQWHYGVYPPSNLDRARALVPGFNPAKTIEQERERRERQEKKDGMAKKDDKKEESAGMILVVVKNVASDVAAMRGTRQPSLVFTLTPESFAMGDFKYNIGIDGLKAGTYILKATAIAFLDPVKAQEFEGPAVSGQN